jgi:sigma-B regulation protein RsbU (phosphoserine phosphatase)
VIENARLAEEEAALVRLEQELNLARDIQMKLLPAKAPRLEGFDVAGRSLAARQVGGDYYDFLKAGENKLGVCLGDVSGKGISAALLVAGVQAVMRGQNLTESPLAVRLSRANQVLYESSDSDKFATFFYAQIDGPNRRLEYSNAGHNPPVLFSDGLEPRLLEVGGPVLGVLPGLPYEQASVDLKAGDLLLIYSDGFSEAMNLRFEEYGEERLHALAGSLRGESAETVIDRVIADVGAFTGDAPQSDDMTIVVVRCTG